MVALDKFKLIIKVTFLRQFWVYWYYFLFLSDPIQDRYCLHLAVQTNDEALVKVLINLGVDCNVIDSNGCTAFMKAAYYGHYQTLNLLLENFPNANLAGKN